MAKHKISNTVVEKRYIEECLFHIEMALFFYLECFRKHLSIEVSLADFKNGVSSIQSIEDSFTDLKAGFVLNAAYRRQFY